MSEREIKIFATVDALNEFAANEFVSLSREAIRERGIFTVALSGGSTPKKLNALLASDAFREKIEWNKIHFFFGDERCVPPDADESNYRMANETLFSKLKIPKKNIHRFLTETYDPKDFQDTTVGCGFGRFDSETQTVSEIADKMSKEIRKVFELKKNEFPCFDLIFLGMGADGHTASLFPESEALNESKRIVVENFVDKFESFRLTFTYPTINNARNIIFLVAGEDKAEALREVLSGAPNPQKFPSQGINPQAGRIQYLIDEKAASATHP